MKIIDIYNLKCNTYSDIYQHLPVLKKYTEECEHVTEMGVRDVVSTWAFLAGKPKILKSIDIVYNSNIELAKQLAKSENIDFEFILGDTRKLTIENTDFLFIDTLHTYSQLKEELKIHKNNVNKYIAFHDTETFKNIDEPLYENQPNNEKGIGLWPAIEEFLLENKDWKILEHFPYNNGFTIITH
jgi:hypothetical protein